MPVFALRMLAKSCVAAMQRATAPTLLANACARAAAGAAGRS